MHLKSLTLKGFKSFAQATTFAFEPGVTCIVGPNGSGKSNVVDALAWVMGEQGAKNLRGGSMADVIFAGTATRGPLGRAEVVLTIDNADGALPIEYGEVAISRTLFRDGRSEYAINGDAVRLLDVQELLSDSGLGREMHVIVGQGQLDAVLRAGPEERRGFIEEAAGILKHRRRRERTLRKLESMQANLARLTDLAEELRRQLKPLGAQAEIAREAAGVQAAVREARTRLLAFDAARLAHEVDRARAAHEQAETARQVAADSAQRLTALVDRLERSGGDGLDAARRTALQLEGVQQRFRDLAQTAAQRVAMLGDEPAPVPADTGAAEREAAALTIADLERRLGEAGPLRQTAASDLERARAALDEVDRGIADAAAAVSRHDREVADAARVAATAEARLQSAEAEARRRRTAVVGARDRVAQAEAELASAPAPTAPEDEAPLPDASVEDRAAEEARTALHALERESSAAQARLAALRTATARPPAVAAVLAALPGAVRLQDVLEVQPEWRTAVAAVLGALTDAALLPHDAALADSAGAAAPLGAVDLILPTGSGVAPDVPGLAAAAVVRAPEGVLRLLDGVALADDLAGARDAIAAGARLAATRDGAVTSATRLRTPGAAVPGVQLLAERDDAEREVARLAQRVADSRTRADATRAAHRAAADARDRAIAQQRARDRASRTAAERSATLRARAEAARAEADRASRQAEDAEAALAPATAARDEARDLAARASARERPVLDADLRTRPARAVEAAQQAALEARLGAETLRERLRAEQQRLAGLERRAEEAERARLVAARRAAERAVQREEAAAVLAEVPAWQASVDRSAAEAATRLAHLEHERRERDTELRAARSELASARAAELETDHRVRDLDMRAYELQVSLGAVRDRAATELGLDARALAAEADESLDRAEEERRLAAAERRLARLGRVNPLALEEFEALEQRHRFLGEQLDDLQRTRIDLLAIVDDLDVRMRQIFAAAFADTEAAFARIFPVLFPGGTGSLSLTDDDEPGVEIAVRPAGKRIERLSLLSGGERSLAAVAFLLAIFTARPSPFYILDEVEAALDDANLGRLLEVISSLRVASQLILITHQKRTMEIADALYGVSMRQDGVSAVIGQRLAART